MITILERYLGRNIISAIALSLSVLMGLSGIIKFVDQLKRFGIWNAGLYTILSLPSDLQIFFPMAALLGVLLGLGALASRSELVVMEALGFTRLRVALAVIKTTLPFMLLSLALNEWVIPLSDMMAVNLRAQALHGGTLLARQGGMWVKDASDFIYIEHIENKNELQGINIYRFDEKNRLNAVVYAEKAIFEQDTWTLYKIKTAYLHTDQPLQAEHQLSGEWRLLLTPDKLEAFSVDPKSLPISKLYHHISYLKKTGQESNIYQLALWRNLLAPLTVIVMMLVALSFIFGPLRQVTISRRVVTGVAVGFTFYVLNQIVSQLSLVYKIPPFVGAALPTMFFCMLFIFILIRAR